jgi:tetratricopeptide (TPR) repeat protein
MATTPLRSYIREIETLIDQGNVDEAIAHARHILTILPKNLSAYRMLGKAFLESQRFGDASDLFMRVLSAVPDDFVSHVGMSIIREDEGHLDAAIWHMERAFEVQPYNSAIQDELRRLYGRRDGVEPHKVRLTRGALARMYARGDLYQQAMTELRSALLEDPQRTDLQVLLARMYYLSGQKVEAVEVCSKLLKKLPNCLEANRIIAAILPETERKDEAPAYQNRVAALDPYLVQSPPDLQKQKTSLNIP